MTADNTPQVKICGLTRADQAEACSILGADAIGCVFYPKSPRNVSPDQAKAIVHALPPHVKGTGVFVNASYDEIMQTVDYCSLAAVQLHGRESPDLVRKLIRQDLLVIKALFMSREPFLHQASDFPVPAYLVECGRGVLPGGNAMAWNWRETLTFGRMNAMILAGGLSPDNIAAALSAAMPAAVDVSSGVESAPGIKDLKKVESFIQTVKQCSASTPLKKIF